MSFPAFLVLCLFDDTLATTRIRSKLHFAVCTVDALILHSHYVITVLVPRGTHALHVAAQQRGSMVKLVSIHRYTNKQTQSTLVVNPYLADDIPLLEHPQLRMVMRVPITDDVTIIHDSVLDKKRPEPAERSEARPQRKIRELEIL